MMHLQMTKIGHYIFIKRCWINRLNKNGTQRNRFQTLRPCAFVRKLKLNMMGFGLNVQFHAFFHYQIKEKQ